MFGTFNLIKLILHKEGKTTSLFVVLMLLIIKIKRTLFHRLDEIVSPVDDGSFEGERDDAGWKVCRSFFRAS